MRLYEYEAKSLLTASGIPCPDERLITTIGEAPGILADCTYPVVLKAQALTGGRGKAGGIQFADDASAALAAVEKLLNMKIRGFDVQSVLVAPRVDIEREIYLGVTIDRTIYKQTMMASQAGGVDIEATAAQNPDAVIRVDLDVDQRFHAFLGVSLGKSIGLTGKPLKQFVGIATRLINLFRRYDAKLVEINPLVLTASGELLALGMPGF